MNRFASRTPVTIADVALLAHVSKTTVSHVLSGNRPVAPTTRRRVEEAIRTLGYRPHGVARSLRTKTSHTVALLIPDIVNPFYPTVARGLEDGLNGGGYRTFICNTDRDAEREVEFLREMGQRGVDGIVLDSYLLSRDVIAEVVPAISLVRMGTTVLDEPGFDSVHGDDERGAHDAPVDPNLMVSGGWTRDGGASAMRRLLSMSAPPTGVFCANDLMALGALDAAREMGVSVPGEVALVGFDDIDAAAYAVPALTTVSNPAYETGLLAGIMLKERMTGQQTGAPRTVTLPCRLIRRSTA